MEQLNPSSGSTGEKITRLIIPVGLGLIGFYFWGTISSFVVMALKNLWTTIALGAPLAFLTLYVLSNPGFIWMSYKNICKSITSFFIKMDPLSYMDRYVDVLRGKKTTLDQTRVNLGGQIKAAERRISDWKQSMDHNLRDAASAKKLGNDNLAGSLGYKVQVDRESIDQHEPMLLRMRKNSEYLDELSENWGMSIDNLSYVIDRKRAEWKGIKEMEKACRTAEDFSRSTEEKRIYEESLRALEDKVSNSLAYIDQFEKDSKGVMDQMKVQKQTMKDEGLQVLEQYMQGGKLLLPNDFSVTAGMNKLATNMPFQPVKGGKFDNLLQ